MTIKEADAYERHKIDMAARMRAKAAAGAEIGEPPPRTQVELWKACEFDLLKFLQTCFPASTSLKPFCEQQIQAVKNQEEVILHGGQIIQAMPRGFGKTTITERAAIWAVLYGHRRYVVVYAANKILSDGIIDSIKTELESNPLLTQMFPDCCHAIDKLDGRANRCQSQTYRGEHTNMTWRVDRLILPTMPKFAGSGSVLEAKAVNAARGSKVTSADTGEVLRPDLILVDDPQTDEDADNPRTVDKICSRLNRSAFMGGGHSRGTAAVMSVTVIEEDDVAERYLMDPNWVAVRYKMMESMPAHLDEMWLGRYAEIRRSFDKTSAESRREAIKAALEYYESNREQMDLGAQPTWDWCYAWNDRHRGEISPTQHAMNILIDKGHDVFQHECQNESIREDEMDRRLHWKEILAKITAIPKNVCPAGTVTITGHIDVGESLLNYALWAWNDDMSGHVIRHATYPEQSKVTFNFREARTKLADVAPSDADVNGAIWYGLEQIIEDVFSTTFTDREGNRVSVEYLGIDIGYAGDTVMRFIDESKYRPLLMPMRGKSTGARMKPISQWRRPKGGGQRAGEEWIYSRPDKGATKVLMFDPNYYKSRHSEGWKAPLGNKIGFTLYKGDVSEHKQFAQQAAVERPVDEEYDGRKVEVWELPINKPDNHYLDNNVGAYVLASFTGMRRKGGKRVKKKRRIL